MKKLSQNVVVRNVVDKNRRNRVTHRTRGSEWKHAILKHVSELTPKTTQGPSFRCFTEGKHPSLSSNLFRHGCETNQVLVFTRVLLRWPCRYGSMAERVFRRVVSKHDKATCSLLFQPYVKLKEDMIMKKCRKDLPHAWRLERDRDVQQPLPLPNGLFHFPVCFLFTSCSLSISLATATWSGYT